MIKSIKEFYNIFVETYHKFHALKFKAKDEIEFYEIEIDTIKNVSDKLRDTYYNLNKIYKYFPIPERQDFVSKTIDLLFYGRVKDGEFIDSYSWVTLYHNQYLTMKNNFLKTFVFSFNIYIPIVFGIKHYIPRMMCF